MRNVTIRFIIVILLIVAAIYAIYPTIRLYTGGESLEKDEVASLQKKAIHLGLDLKGGMHLVLSVDKTNLSEEEAKGAVDRALEVIRNRIDQFGVFEPTIEKMSGDRIMIQLPGVDRERAINLIKQVALLEFKLVEDEKRTMDIMKSLDRYFQKQEKIQMRDTAFIEEIPFSEFFTPLSRGAFAIDIRDEDTVRKMLAQAESLIPGDVEFAFGLKQDFKGKPMRPVYLLKKAAELKGDAIRDATHGPWQGTDLNLMGSWIVELEFNRKAASRFAAITGANIGRQLAIVLDGVVQSAPEIRERIPQGRAMITGRFTPEEARDLAIVLKAGALPAPVRIIEERSVGPSLGRDSITKGLRASLLSAIFVVVFMMIYYSLSGLVANFALCLNILMLIGILSVFQGTLTMPGIAGVALTIAMSVDANILIFERIREELAIGKTVRTAIDQGYARAWLAIFDSNVTTIITGIVIYILGTGPIRGFALTLIIGLVANLLTAVFVTKAVFDYFTTRFEISKLRI